MTKDDCYQVGHITKTHGVNGELVFFLDVDDAKEYADIDSILIEVKGQLTPYFIESISIVKGSRAIVALEDVETIEQAERFIGSGLWLPLANLEPIDDETRFYFHEIIGFRVLDAEKGPLGTVTAVYTMATQDLIAMDYAGHEVLIPINSDIVPSVNRAQNQINVVLPEGLLEIYTSDTGNDKPEVDGDEEADDTDED
ncbi:16S rRNA processing protein RimM [Rudanella paleaurantiibacter]|uniref:Ribosome maturation factor RimM n=1 Tax=Rudanella paleaurantiibacter TaxID=2614655 RepID=A0A7J5TYZ3_9BACT|nr:ribosome maturation factor RimM [Rudanella paleaurantiibacter]KAB7730344.1 16S rRNA processing protein RimM [Rudanella paleaurantiibacter]